MIGWIKLHRKLADKAFYTKDSEMVHLWVHLLFCANHKGREESLGGKPFQCKPGQFTTGRKQLSKETGISESKIERILLKFEKIEQQIEQQKMSTNRLISILNWHEYQKSEQQTDQQANNDRTTSEQRVDTPKEDKELKNENNEIKIDLAKAKLTDLISEFTFSYDSKLLSEFYDYWTEPNPSRTKCRYQLEKTWDTGKRIARWASNQNKFNGNKNGKPELNKLENALKIYAETDAILREELRKSEENG